MMTATTTMVASSWLDCTLVSASVSHQQGSTTPNVHNVPSLVNALNYDYSLGSRCASMQAKAAPSDIVVSQLYDV